MSKYIISVEGKSMTTQEYLNKIKAEQFDEEFDKAVLEATKKRAEIEAKKEHEQEFVNLMTKLSDIESELDIAEKLYKENIFNVDVTKHEREEIVKHIKYLKVQQTKTENKIKSFLTSESK